MLTSFKEDYYFDEIKCKAFGVELPKDNYKYIKDGIADDGEAEYYIG